MIAEPVLSEPAERFVASLSRDERVGFYRAVEALCLDPRPDGHRKVPLPFPPRAGTLGFSYGDFWMAYSVLPDGRVLIAMAYWSPGSPRHPCHGSS